MIKKTVYYLLILITVFSCSKIKVEPSEDLDVNNFIWKGLNAFYLWQEDVPNLANNRFLNSNSYQSFLGSETNSENFFESLLYQRSSVDKWSWIVQDYVALENSFQGISIHNGMEFGLVYEKGSTTNIFGYVRYVLPNTDASSKNVTRGMVFSSVNGEKLTINNYKNLLFSNTDYSINLADYNSGNPISNGTSIPLTKSEYTENPVLITKTISSGSKKIGYIMYNSFTSNFDSQLNAAFLTLKNEAITDLVIDFRYNGGGSVASALYLSSMITGQFKGQLFSKQFWNNKIKFSNPEQLEDHFTDQIDTGGLQESIHSLSLDKVHIITTGSSASASELVINGLKPYIDVITIGTKTHGKYVGSITLYDSPQLYNKEDINISHNWAMQPIVLEIKNKLNTNDKDGFDADILLAEDFSDLGVLGEVSDPLLNRAITYITTGLKGKYQVNENQFIEFFNSKLAQPASNNMYIKLK
jgi:carboxyl-terminal processing protease